VFALHRPGKIRDKSEMADLIAISLGGRGKNAIIDHVAGV
jgi:hypothetical protein